MVYWEPYSGNCQTTQISRVRPSDEFSTRRYIASGNGKGNAYGLAAVCAVAFPFIFFARLYWPIPPVSNLIVGVLVSPPCDNETDSRRFSSCSSPLSWYVRKKEVSCAWHVLIWRDLGYLSQILGFSWQDTHFPSGFVYFGIDVSWVRAQSSALFFRAFI